VPFLRRTLEGRWGIGRGDDAPAPPLAPDPDERVIAVRDEARPATTVTSPGERRP